MWGREGRRSDGVEQGGTARTPRMAREGGRDPEGQRGPTLKSSYSKKGRNLLTCTLSEDLFFKGVFKVCAERVIRRCDRASRPSGLYMHKDVIVVIVVVIDIVIVFVAQ